MKNTNTKTCSIENCEKPSRTRGWCEKHYARYKRHGDPLYSVYNNPARVFRENTEWQGSCLVWTGPTAPNGYGRIRVEGRQPRVHRYAWEQENGPIPEGMFLDHICYNRVCCNVKHLRLATNSENVANRSGPNKGSSSGSRNVYAEGNRWSVMVSKDHATHRFGAYETIEEAAVVAEQARLELFGEFAGRG